VFSSLLQSSAFCAPIDDKDCIIIGNENGTNVLTKACNPYCAPCGRSIAATLEVVKQRPDLKVRVVFVGISNDMNSEIDKAVAFLVQQARFQTLLERELLLSKWYSSNGGAYKEEVGMVEIDENTISVLSKMKVWSENSSIKHTPYNFYNGHLMPSMYSLSDLSFIK
jgi:hypothetical protein